MSDHPTSPISYDQLATLVWVLTRREPTMTLFIPREQYTDLTSSIIGGTITPAIDIDWGDKGITIKSSIKGLS